MFVLKKVISQLFCPVPLCLGLLITGLLLLFFTRRQKAGKFFVLAGVILFAASGYQTIPNMLLRPLEYQYQSIGLTDVSDVSSCNALPTVRWIVVLGGGHVSDPNIPITSQLSEASMVRLIEGVRLHNRMPGSKLILSEGRVFDKVAGAETMAAVATSVGVREEDIILEAESMDTIDEAWIIKKIIKNDQFILVTSAVHMPRSMAMFKKLDMRPIPAPTGHWVFESQGINPGAFFPNSVGLYKAQTALHEYLGILWAKLRGQI